MKKILLALISIICLISSNAIALTDEQIKLDKALNSQATIVKVTPAEAVKDEAFAYNVYGKILKSTKKFSIKVSHSLTQVFVPIIFILMVTYLGFMTCQHLLKNEEWSTFFAKNISFIFYIAMILFVFSNYGIFVQMVFDFFIGVAGKILSIATDGTDLLKDNNIRSDLQKSFKVGEILGLGVENITNLYVKQNVGILGDVGVSFKGLVLTLVYYIISCAYMIVWTLSSISMIIFFALGKPLLLLSIFPPLRKYIVSWGEAIIAFGFTMIFVSLAMGLTIFTVADTFIEYDTLMKAGKPLGGSVYFELFMVGILSIFYHVSASTMSAMLTKSHVQDFGRTFTAGASLAMGGAKLAGMKGISVGAGMGVAGSNRLIGSSDRLAGGLKTGIEKGISISSQYFGGNK